MVISNIASADCFDTTDVILKLTKILNQLRIVDSKTGWILCLDLFLDMCLYYTEV